MDIDKMISERDVAAIAAFARDNNLILVDRKLVPRDSEAKMAAKVQVDFWDKRQLARKILKV